MFTWDEKYSQTKEAYMQEEVPITSTLGVAKDCKAIESFSQSKKKEPNRAPGPHEKRTRSSSIADPGTIIGKATKYH